ncbi:DUF177 domain-containing protein [uncultured Roseibium sp.]|uniref:YceD family protein n=1 Tax=uncultured Roseibium sp. TaxID=1936171 RepID=UPI002623A1FB|nr:DUF177 domain-containing protein [uncultured Roseibium sp.]
MATGAFPYSHSVKANRVVDKDETIVVEPGGKQQQEIAEAYDLLEIKGFKARFTLKPYRKEGVRVVGTISAAIVQTCVVSLEPFESSLLLEVDRTFEPVSSRPARIRDLNEDGEIEIDLESLDPPDVLVDGVLDLGALICEELALSLDPFPRRPGVEFEGSGEENSAVEEEAEKKPSPFAALEGLKTRKED